jgi:hypothetical protein
MKTILFFFALLAGITASANVYVTPLSADYIKKTVTFRVEWTGDAANNRVWVFIDFCPMDGTTSGTFAQAVISGATATAGSINAATLPGRGFYVTANLTTVTATLSNADGQFNWCVYGSDFPPNAVDDGSGYILRGSLPFKITTTTGALEVNAYGYTGGTVTAITDATGEPGILCGGENESAGLLKCCKNGLKNCNGTCKTACAAIEDSQCRLPCFSRDWNNSRNTYIPTYVSMNNSLVDSPTDCAAYATANGYFTYYWWKDAYGQSCCLCK